MVIRLFFSFFHLDLLVGEIIRNYFVSFYSLYRVFNFHFRYNNLKGNNEGKKTKYKGERRFWLLIRGSMLARAGPVM